jgi:1-phosphofructokinase
VFEPVEQRGPGDSMFAAIVASLARGRPIEEALRLGVAAGALNVTRRGLGSGTRDEVERLARGVELRPLAPA